MVFILLFVLATLAIPLSFEIYRRGNDNVLQRSFKDIHNVVPSLRIRRAVSGSVDVLLGLFIIIVAITLFLLALKVVLMVLALIFGWIVS